MKKATVLVIGGSESGEKPNIGGRLKQRLVDAGHRTVSINKRILTASNNPSPESVLEQLVERHGNFDAVFLCIPTSDQGETARDYIKQARLAGAVVVTCEKGSLAYHASSMQRDCVGYSATVGGGTMMLPVLQARCPNSHKMRIEAVINGTLNFVFSEIERGRTLSEACSEAIALGYAEPGATDEVSLINGELADIVMKTCVLFNTTLGRKKTLNPFFAKGFKLTLEDIENLSDVAADYRFIVTFSNTSGSMGDYLGTKFETEQEGWRIAGGFRRISRSSAFDWVPNGVSNALHIVEGDRLGKGGSYTVSGPGAGLEPTTTAMLNDFERLMATRL